MRLLALFSCILFSALLSSCGSAVGCDFRETGANGPEPRCQERSGLGSAVFASTCEALAGVAVEGGCPPEGIVAGCDLGTQGDGTAVIDWYYAPETRETVEQNCLDDDATLLDP